MTGYHYESWHIRYVGKDLAKKVDADIVLANDPDADRLGIYVKDTRTGEYSSRV